MINRSGQRIVLSILALDTLLLPCNASAIEANWDGGGDGVVWSDPDNWDPDLVPDFSVNNFLIASIGFNPGYPANVTAVLDIDTTPASPSDPPVISTLNIGLGSTLQLAPGGNLTAFLMSAPQNSVVHGHIEGLGGHLSILDEGPFEGAPELPDPYILGDQATISATNGSQIRIKAQSYSPTGFEPGDTTIFSATGVSGFPGFQGSLIDLSSLESLDASIDLDNGGSQTTDALRIRATAGGSIDLSALTQIKAPVQYSDFLEVLVQDSASSIHLDSLRHTKTNPDLLFGGTVFFKALDGATQSLPGLETALDTQFIAEGGGVINVDGDEPVVYTAESTSLLAFSGDLMRAAGAGSQLNLSAISVLDISLDRIGNSNSLQHVSDALRIRANTGGSIDLSGVTKIMAPVQYMDFLEITVEDASSSINLDGLEHAKTNPDLPYGGIIYFTAKNGGAHALPSLQTAVDTSFHADNGGVIDVSGIAPVSYSATSTSLLAFAGDLLRAAGAGSQLNLGAVTSLDASFDPSNSSADKLFIRAGGGGSIDLSNLTTITTPVDAEDFIEVIVEDGQSSIDLSSLVSVFSNGAGQLALRSTDGRITLGDVHLQTSTWVLAETAGSDISFGDLQSGADLQLRGSVSAESYTQNSGRLSFELGGLTPGAGHAQIQSDQQVVLSGAGGLLLVGGYTPTLYDTHVVLTGSSVTGVFGSVSGVNYATGVGLAVTYSEDEVLVTAALLGDTDLDGDVDDADLGTIISRFTGPVAPVDGSRTWVDGDTNGDGDVDDADIGSVISAFTGPKSPNPVPEPGVGVVLLTGLAALTGIARPRAGRG